MLAASFRRRKQAVVIVTDPNYANVILLMHANGTNGGTTFTDNSPLALAGTAIGNAQTETAAPKYGSACYLGDGTGDRVTFAVNAANSLGTGDWTMECWFKSSNPSAPGCLIGQEAIKAAATNASLYLNGSGTNVLNFYEANTAKISAASATTSDGAWHHLAVVRSSTTVTMYLDGNSVGSYTTSFTFWSGAVGSSVGAIGGGTVADCLAGRIDDVRVTKGVARYTSNFTAPIAEFPNS